MARILVLGAGICGLGTAMLLARDGHDVTVLDRDDAPLPDSPLAAWDAWGRKGIAQFRQPHNFMPGLRKILEAELPDVQDSLRRAGASKFDMLAALPPSISDRSARPIDDALWTYTARRPVGEWVFADAAQKEPNVEVRRGVKATALVTGSPTRPGTPHVNGVRTADGAVLRADLVVDAMGRASRSPRWLAEIGATEPSEEQADSGFAYYTRYFRGSRPQLRAPVLSALGTISVLTLPGDNDTWSVTIFTAVGDKPLRALRQTDKWTSAIRACPLQAHWIDAEPLTDVLAMSGVVDRYRRPVVDDAPVATGLVSLADAWACTNPSAGRGLTVGLKHGLRFRDVLREQGDDPYVLAVTFDRVTEAELAPWYRAQVAIDRCRFAEMEALRDGLPPPAPADGLARQCISLLATMGLDADLFRAGMEYIGTITPIQQILEREDVGTRVRAAWEALGGVPPPPLPGPSREQLLSLVA